LGNRLYLIDITDLPSHLAKGQRLLGLDPGTKTIGLALSDVLLRFATPSHTIRRTKMKADGEAIKTFCDKENVGGLIIGLPLNMDGSEGPRVQSVKAFQRNLAEYVPLPVVFWDERLSTAAAERSMIEADLSRAKRAKQIDAAAAGFILQGALDRLSRL
jgi:putative Holliday junction resolvase